MARSGFRLGGAIILGLLMVAFGLYQYYSNSSVNTITHEKQRITISPQEEIALGKAGKNQVINEFGGLYDDSRLQIMLNGIGQRLVQYSIAKKTPYQYQFTILGDRRTVNAFALPGGQVFITYALLKLLKTEEQIAGVLSHEIAHVVARHSAEKIAEMQLTNSLTGAAAVASGSATAAQVAAVIGNLVNMKYGREQELQSDDLGIRFLTEAGYNTNGMLEVMRILESSAGTENAPEFASTHPNPENRIAHINEAIKKYSTLVGSKGDKELPQQN